MSTRTLKICLAAAIAAISLTAAASAAFTVREQDTFQDGSDLDISCDARVTKSYRLMPGQAGIYQDGAIHSIDYPDRSRFVRVTGTNLDKIARSMFDPKTGKVAQMTPQRAT